MQTDATLSANNTQHCFKAIKLSSPCERTQHCRPKTPQQHATRLLRPFAWALTLSYTGFFGLASHGVGGGGGRVGIHHTFITLVLFDGFEQNLVQ